MLAETSAEAARRFGSSPAFVTDEGLAVSYAEFDAMADETAVGLAELGVGRGTWSGSCSRRCPSTSSPMWPRPSSAR